MRQIIPSRRALLLGAAALPFLIRRAAAAEVAVMTSGGLTAAYRILGPEFERTTGHTLRTVQGASMGAAPDAIPQRLARGEAADVLLLAAEGLEALIARGAAQPGSRVDIARSLIGLAVRAGAPKPDISTVESFRQALLAAGSIAYSASASGVYIETEMFRRLGIHEQVAPKSRRIYSERVGSVVARGEAEIGFQPGLDQTRADDLLRRHRRGRAGAGSGAGADPRPRLARGCIGADADGAGADQRQLAAGSLMGVSASAALSSGIVMPGLLLTTLPPTA